MGFYLPGIGEAIGGALRMKRQNELMAASQDILRDESKPWSERVAMVTAAHPELATNPQLQQMLETGRQADADKMQRTKYDQEQATVTENAQFKALYDKQSPDGKAAMLQNNPDMVSRVYPEIYKQHSAQQAAAAKEAEWMKHNQITSGQADARAQVAAGGQNARNMLTMFANGLVDANGQPIPPAAQAAAKRQETLLTEQAKAEQKQAEAGKGQEQLTSNLLTGLDNYKQHITEKGHTGWVGSDASTRESMRQSLGVALAQMANPGRAPTDADVKVAMDRIPEVSPLNSPEAVSAAIDQLKTDLGGFKPSLGSKGVTLK
jgi:hypothetical protein